MAWSMMTLTRGIMSFEHVTQAPSPGPLGSICVRHPRLRGPVVSVSTTAARPHHQPIVGVPVRATLGAFISLIRPRPTVEPKFLYHVLAWGKTQERIRGTASTTTNISNVSTKKLATLQLAVPNLDEQRRIVAEIEKQFSRLDEAVGNLQRVKANLRRHRAAVLKAAFEGVLVQSESLCAKVEGRDFESGGALLGRVLQLRKGRWLGRGKYKEPIAPDVAHVPVLPDGWTWASVDQLSRLVTSGSRGWGEFYSESGVLFIRAQDIKTDALNRGGISRVNVPGQAEGTRSAVEACDVLVTITGANVTKSALVPRLGEEAYVSQHVALLKFVSAELAPYIFAWIVSPANGRKVLEKWAYGAGKPGLSLEQVRALPVALPPLAEQQRIVAEIDRRLSIVREVEAEVETNLKRAQALRQAVLCRAFKSEDAS